MSSETNDYKDTEMFQRLNLNNFNKNDPKLSATDEICKSCTPKRFCENCLKNGILLSSFISDSDHNYNKRTVTQRATEPNSQNYGKLTNIYEYNLHLLAAICVLEDEKIVRKPKYRPSDFVPEGQCSRERQQVITAATSVVLNTQSNHNSNNNSTFSDRNVLSSKEEFGIFSRSKNRHLKIYREIGSFQETREALCYAQSFCLSNNDDIIVVDKNNHRIKVFDKNGLFKLGFGEFGRQNGHLFYPHRVEAMPDGRIIVCDQGVRLQIFDCFGNFEKKVMHLHNDEDFISFTITYDGKIVALSKSLTVLIMTEHGKIVHKFCCHNFVTDARDIVTNGPYIYICDFKGHGVVVFDHNGNCKRKIGNFSDTPYPTGIDVICSNGAILISGCRLSSYVIKSFTTTGTFISNFTLRGQIQHTSGLKVTTDGLIITLDKHNNKAITMKAFRINNLVSSQ